MENSIDTPVQVKEKDVDRIISIAHEMAHFSAKAVNTNTSGGVRLDSSVKVNLPYLSVSTIGAQAVPLDSSSAASNASIAKYVLENKDTDPELSEITSKAKLLNLHYLDNNNARLKQIIHKIYGIGYTSLTPLPSAGLSKLIRDRSEQYEKEEAENIKQYNDSLKEQKDKNRSEKVSAIKSKVRYRNKAIMSFGGSNPINGGLHLSFMAYPLFFSNPKEDIEIKKAYACYYKGNPIRIDRRHLIEYKRLILAHKSKGFGIKKMSDSEYKEKERGILEAIISEIFVEANALRASILKNLDIKLDEQGKPVEPICIAKNAINVALLSGSGALLKNGHLNEFAKLIRNKIITQKIIFNELSKEKETVGLGSKETERLITIIEELARCRAVI